MITISKFAEECAEKLLATGNAISGFEGNTAETYKSRYSLYYSEIKGYQISNREKMFQEIGHIYDWFLELDNSVDAKISLNTLDDNSAHLRRMEHELTCLSEDYNRSLAAVAHTGIFLEDLNINKYQDFLDDKARHFRNLATELSITDTAVVKKLEECCQLWEEQIGRILSLFQAEVKTVFLKQLKNILPENTIEKIESVAKDAKYEMDKKFLLEELESNKARIIAEYDLSNPNSRVEDANFQEFVEEQMNKLYIHHLYEERIRSATEVERYELQGDVIFLTSIHFFGYSAEDRIKILEELKPYTIAEKMPELSKEFFEKNGMEAPDKHGRAILELEYRASREQRTLYMDEIDFQNAHLAKLSAFLATTTYMAMMDYNYQYNNPDTTTANLDPNVRLDKMELDSLNQGFKTVDYVPLTSEALDAKKRIDGVFDEYNIRVIKTQPSDEVNKTFSKDFEPPYKPETQTQVVEVTQDTKVGEYVRVYDNVNSTQAGGWVMQADDIAGLTPQQIQNKFALPSTPTHVTDVIFEAGTQLRTGIANSAFGFEGGGTQFDMMGQRVGEFINGRPLQ